MGTNEMKRANGITLKNDYMSFCPNKLFHTNEFLNMFFCKLLRKLHVILKVNDIFFKFLNKYEFLKNVSITCKFCVSYFEMITISN